MTFAGFYWRAMAFALFQKRKSTTAGRTRLVLAKSVGRKGRSIRSFCRHNCTLSIFGRLAIQSELGMLACVIFSACYPISIRIEAISSSNCKLLRLNWAGILRFRCYPGNIGGFSGHSVGRLRSALKPSCRESNGRLFDLGITCFLRLSEEVARLRRLDSGCLGLGGS